MSRYTKFGLMIAVATIVMYPLMYLNTFATDHVFFSETRLYMAFLMGSVMAVIMLAFMHSMLRNKVRNVGIVVGSIVVFISSLYLMRSQSTVDDLSWMRAMIPHHSIAILTSKRADIRDPRVKDLANRIIDSQTREIEEMKRYIDDLEHGRSTEESAPTPAVSH